MTDVQLSVVIPILERSEELLQNNAAYLAQLDAYGASYEVIYVLDNYTSEVADLIAATVEARENCHMLELPRTFGDATALASGLQEAEGQNILILPPYAQVEPSEVTKLVDKLDEFDVVVAERERSSDSWLNKLQARAFNMLSNRVTNLGIKDTTSEVRALKSYVAKELDLYGDMHRFLPHLAYRVGFRIGSVNVAQPPQETQTKLYDVGTYVRRLLDVLTALFLLRFTKKPLRFFGLIGASMIVTGSLILAYLVAVRLFMGIDLADRPGLFLGALILVLGLQVVAIGLVGEIVIFCYAKTQSEYRVREIVDYRSAPAADGETVSGSGIAAVEADDTGPPEASTGA